MKLFMQAVLLDESAIQLTASHALGTNASCRLVRWYVRREHYVVALVDAGVGFPRVLMKLDTGHERPDRRLAVMAAASERVRRETPVPVGEVLAVDTTRQHLPWDYLVTQHLPGVTWGELYERLDRDARLSAQRQIGVAAAHVHTLRFEGFGPLSADGEVVDGAVSFFAALRTRVQRRLHDTRARAFFLDALSEREAWFGDVSRACLSHEDLNPHNVLFEVGAAGLVLTGVLDFELAWAGLGESDLARLELWRLTAGSAVRNGYLEVAGVSAGYERRRPLLQLLWCLEFGQHRPTAQHQADTGAVCQELGLSSFRFRPAP